MKVTITLDSGFFLPKTGSFCEIGYFQGEGNKSDITVTVDGKKTAEPTDPLKLGDGNCTVQVHHKNADGTTKDDGVTVPVPFHSKLLHLKDLYHAHIEVDRDKFDCILRFESGALGAEDVRKRTFHKFKLKELKLSSSADEAFESKAIAHDVSFRFTLADGESIELTRDGKPFWSSADLEVKESLDIRIDADGPSTEKFYRYCFKNDLASYWIPNPQDPPPSCPSPPCEDGGGG